MASGVWILGRASKCEFEHAHVHVLAGDGIIHSNMDFFSFSVSQRQKLLAMDAEMSAH